MIINPAADVADNEQPTAVFMTECTQIPAILKRDGSYHPYDPEFQNLPDRMRDQIAQLVGGKVVWIKVRRQYLALDSNHCTHKDCYSLVSNSNDRCDSHRLLSN